MSKSLSKASKRMLCLAVVAVFVLATVLSGCGGSPAATSTTAAGGAATTGAAGGSDASKLPHVDLTWYMRGNGPEKDGQMVYDAASKYLQPLINASIKIVDFDRGSYDQKVTASIASGETFDICFTSSYAVNYVENALKGAFVPLNDPKTDLLDKYAPKTKALLGPEFLAGSAINGINYALPVNKEKAHSYGFVLRKDIIDKDSLDISQVQSLASQYKALDALTALEPILKTVQQKEPTMAYPISEATRDNSSVIMDWARSSINDNIPVAMYGDNRDQKWYDILETPEEMNYFHIIHKFYTDGLIRKDAATVSDYSPDLEAGKIFAKEVTTIPHADEQMTAQYGVPYLEVNFTQPAMTNDETMGAMQAISRTSKNPERALMFLELMNTDKYLCNLINYGIEGVHYVKKGDNTIDYMPDSQNGKLSTYNPQMQWGFANEFLTYLFPNQNPNVWKDYETYNQNAIKTNSLGFLMDQSPVKTQIAAVLNVAQEFMPALETGAADPDTTVPKAIQKLKDAGVDQVIAEVQKQYDAWKAKQPK